MPRDPEGLTGTALGKRAQPSRCVAKGFGGGRGAHSPGLPRAQAFVLGLGPVPQPGQRCPGLLFGKNEIERFLPSLNCAHTGHPSPKGPLPKARRGLYPLCPGRWEAGVGSGGSGCSCPARVLPARKVRGRPGGLHMRLGKDQGSRPVAAPCRAGSKPGDPSHVRQAAWPPRWRDPPGLRWVELGWPQLEGDPPPRPPRSCVCPGGELSVCSHPRSCDPSSTPRCSRACSNQPRALPPTLTRHPQPFPIPKSRPSAPAVPADISLFVPQKRSGSEPSPHPQSSPGPTRIPTGLKSQHL